VIAMAVAFKRHEGVNAFNLVIYYNTSTPFKFSLLGNWLNISGWIAV